MEDSRVFGSYYGLTCFGKLQATRCTFEENRGNGLEILLDGQVELVDCVIRKNEGSGISADGEDVTVLLRGGTITENTRSGVIAGFGAKVTVAEEDGLLQTVCKGNYKPSDVFAHVGPPRESDWSTSDSGEIIGIPQEKIDVSNE